MTSQPRVTPSESKARCSAPVPEEVASDGFPNLLAKAASNSCSNLPAWVTNPVSMHSLRYFFSFPSRIGLANGIRGLSQSFPVEKAYLEG